MASPAVALGADAPFDAALREAHSRLMAVHTAAISTLEAELQRMRNENTFLRMQLTTVVAEASIKVEPKQVAPVDRKAETLPEQALQVIPTNAIAPTTLATADVRLGSAAPAAQPPALQIVQVVPERALVTDEQSAPVTLAPSGLTSGNSPKGPSPGAHVRPTLGGANRATPTQEEPPISREGSLGVADEGAPTGAAQRKVNIVTVASGPRPSSNAKNPEAVVMASAASALPVEVVTVLKAQELPDSGSSTSAVTPAISSIPVMGTPVAGASTTVPAASSSVSVGVEVAPSATTAGVQVAAAMVSLGSVPASTTSASGSAALQAASAGRLVQPNHHSDSASDLDMTTPRPPATPKLDASINGAASAQVASTAEQELSQEVIEVITPGAMQAIGDGVVEQDVDRALEAVLAYHGWQHLDVQKIGKDSWSFSGALVQIRCEASPVGNGADHGPPYNLQASADDGRTWEQLEGLIRHRRLHKVVRTAPIASALDGKMPTGPNQLETPPSQSLNQAPISLADLARMPSRASPVEGHMVLQGRASVSGRSQRSRESSRDRPGSPHGSVGYHQGGASAGSRPPSGSYNSSKHPQLLPIGADGLPTHRHDGLPNFNNAFPTYFDALSGPTNYYNSFRIAGARGPDPYG